MKYADIHRYNHVAFFAHRALFLLNKPNRESFEDIDTNAREINTFACVSICILKTLRRSRLPE